MKIFVLSLVALLFVAPAFRLLDAARRTGHRPELWAALFFIGAGVGLPLRLYGSAIYHAEPELATTINVLGHLFFGSGAIAMTLFTRRVFHPEGSRARLVAGAIVASIVGTSAYSILSGLASAETSYAILGTNFARLLPTYWAFYESLHYWRAMRKRAALGLSDPVVTNRFMLWAVWTAAVSILPTAALILRLVERIASAAGHDVAAAGLTPTVFLGLRVLFAIVSPIAVLALSLSFFPPERYLARIRANAANAPTP